MRGRVAGVRHDRTSGGDDRVQYLHAAWSSDLLIFAEN
jgi:hypothetical protein